MLTYAIDYLFYNLNHNTAYVYWLKWIGTIIILFPSASICLFPETAELILPFVLYLIGATLWAISGWIVRDMSMFTVNMIFIIVDVIAIYLRAI